MEKERKISVTVGHFFPADLGDNVEEECLLYLRIGDKDVEQILQGWQLGYQLLNNLHNKDLFYLLSCTVVLLIIFTVILYIITYVHRRTHR